MNYARYFGACSGWFHDDVLSRVVAVDESGGPGVTVGVLGGHGDGPVREQRVGHVVADGARSVEGREVPVDPEALRQVEAVVPGRGVGGGDVDQRVVPARVVGGRAAAGGEGGGCGVRGANGHEGADGRPPGEGGRVGEREPLPDHAGEVECGGHGWVVLRGHYAGTGPAPFVVDPGGGLEGGYLRHVDGWRGGTGGEVADELGVVLEGRVVGEVVHVHGYRVEGLGC